MKKKFRVYGLLVIVGLSDEENNKVGEKIKRAIELAAGAKSEGEINIKLVEGDPKV